jgi:5'-methylthioadenosine nucleosidase
MNVPSRVVVIMALDSEARPVIDQLGLQRVPVNNEGLPLEDYRGQIEDQKTHRKTTVDVLVNGRDPLYGVNSVGTEPSVLTTHWAIRHLQPDLVFNAGTAGAFQSKGSDIGDVYIGSDTRYHDHRIPIPEDREYAECGLHCAPPYTQYIAERLDLPKAHVSTGASLDITANEKRQMENIHGPVVKEMEAASINKLLTIFGIPCVVIKSVTDLIDHGTSTTEQFLKNLNQANQALARQVVAAIKEIAHMPASSKTTV